MRTPFAGNEWLARLNGWRTFGRFMNHSDPWGRALCTQSRAWKDGWGCLSSIRPRRHDGLQIAGGGQPVVAPI